MKKQYKQYKVNDEVTIQVISYTKEMMIAHLWFTGKGFTLAHHHLNQEANTVLSGKFEATNGDEKTILTAGETMHVYSDLPHNIACLTPTGEIITCWTPARQDIIEKYTEVQ